MASARAGPTPLSSFESVLASAELISTEPAKTTAGDRIRIESSDLIDCMRELLLESRRRTPRRGGSLRSAAPEATADKQTRSCRKDLVPDGMVLTVVDALA